MTDGKVKDMKIENVFANKRLSLIIIGLLLLLFFILLIRLITFSPSSENPPIIVVPKASFSPTPESISQQPFPSVAFATPSAFVKPLVYKPGELTRDYERISSRQPLSSEDQAIKTRLLTPLNSRSGIITTTPQFQLEYVQSPDLFMVEVRSTNPITGKNAAENYLKNQGLSNSGICNLPVVFYLSQQVQNDLISKGQTFNPIPTGC
jgi:hypothetical protein